jgi:hypothetical protein
MWKKKAHPGFGMGLCPARGPISIQKLFLVFERITNGDAGAGCVRSAEFNIIMDQINVHRGLDKDAWRGIKSQACAQLGEEVIAGNNICATNKTASDIWRVKMNALGPDTSGEFGLRTMANGRRIDSIHIVEKWTKRLHAFKQIFLGAQRCVKFNAGVVKEKKIHAENAPPPTVWSVAVLLGAVTAESPALRSNCCA